MNASSAKHDVESSCSVIKYTYGIAGTAIIRNNDFEDYIMHLIKPFLCYLMLVKHKDLQYLKQSSSIQTNQEGCTTSEKTLQNNIKECKIHSNGRSGAQFYN